MFSADNLSRYVLMYHFLFCFFSLPSFTLTDADMLVFKIFNIEVHIEYCFMEAECSLSKRSTSIDQNERGCVVSFPSCHGSGSC